MGGTTQNEDGAGDDTFRGDKICSGWFESHVGHKNRLSHQPSLSVLACAALVAKGTLHADDSSSLTSFCSLGLATVIHNLHEDDEANIP